MRILPAGLQAHLDSGATTLCYWKLTTAVGEVMESLRRLYAGLLAQWPRSASALRQVLTDYFDVPVEIEQFAGGWFRLDRETQCCFEDGASISQPFCYRGVLRWCRIQKRE